MKNFFYKIFITSLIFFTFQACKKKDEVPPKEDIPGSCSTFNVLTPFELSANGSLDIDNDSLTMWSKFNQPESWTISIVGESSGAKKSFSGTGDSLKVVWKGESDNSVYFTSETVTVKFKVSCQDTIVKTISTLSQDCHSFSFISPFELSGNPSNIDFDNSPMTLAATFSQPTLWSITITGQVSGAKKTFSGNGNSVNLNWYGGPDTLPFFQDENVDIKFKAPCTDTILKTVSVSNCRSFAHYQGLLISDFEGNGSVPNTFAMGYTASGWSSYASGTITEFGLESYLTPPNGNNYMTFKGDAAGWSLGGTYTSISLSSLATNDPDEIYFNAFIHNGNTSTTLTISLIGTGGPYIKTFNIDGTGWDFVSYKLSDFSTIIGGAALSNPNTISGLEFFIGPTHSPGESVEANFDFIIFTENAPLMGE